MEARMKSIEKVSKTHEAISRTRASLRQPEPSVLQGGFGFSNIQQIVGNLAIQRMLQSGLIQAKLSISQPYDPYEQEADRVADRVMRMSEPTVRRKCAACAAGGSCPKCDEEKKIQTKELPGHTPQITPKIESSLASLRGGGQPMPASMRIFFESRFGQDFSGVRLHTGGEAAQLNRAISAQAFTHGQDIYLGDSKDNFESSAGEQLLAHELTHVIQQSRQGGSQLQRTCSQSAAESFYQTAGNYCKDTGFSGVLHPGQRCYREVPRRSSYGECPPGDQVCFDEKGKCHDSYDRASTVEGKNSDGTCNLHGLCFIKHAFLDIIPGVFQEGADEQAREYVECMNSCKNLNEFAKSLCETECRRESRLIP